MSKPLADRLRPETLDEVVGQSHIIGEGKVLTGIARSGNVPNMIFYGPSGTGKTTVANILAKVSGKALYKLNATTASVGDIRDVCAQTETFEGQNGILLYLDEIQNFNKKQQQSLLEHIENGKISLIASTTENPYFYVYNAILSRSTVFEFKALTAQSVRPAVERAIAIMSERLNVTVRPEEGVVSHICASCGGDVRKAINAVEILFSAAVASDDGNLVLTLEDAGAVSQKSAMRYDREGDDHFDILSALHKSCRGSDPDAAIHYLARLLEAGDLISPCRRLLCVAAEDVGLAYPQAISIVKACVDSALQLGLPEARLPLAEAVILLCTAPKSNTAMLAIDRASADIRHGKSGNIPRELQNVHADSAGQEREQGYLYPHDYPGRWVRQQYLPDELRGVKYYEYGENKTEQAAKAYWEGIKR